MDLRTPPPETARAGLRAMKTVALADGVFHDLERSLLMSMQRHVLKTDLDLDALEPISPEELAAAVPDGDFRQRMVRAMVMVALIDSDASSEEEAVVDGFARAFKVDRAPVRELTRAVHKRLVTMRLDIIRRGFIGKRMKQHLKKKKLRGLIEAARAIMGGTSPALAEKYQALRDYPEGSLGHAYVAFIDVNDFSFPGEAGGPPEPILFHDCVHVLAEYGTTAEEEVQVIAFQAGAQNFDPFFTLMFAFAQFHLGIEISPVAGVDELKIDPDDMLRAFMRGTECTRDPTSDWDPWDDFHRPVGELRTEFNIVPRV